jgi:hypothetical protein
MSYSACQIGPTALVAGGPRLRRRRPEGTRGFRQLAAEGVGGALDAEVAPGQGSRAVGAAGASTPGRAGTCARAKWWEAESRGPVMAGDHARASRVMAPQIRAAAWPQLPLGVRRPLRDGRRLALMLGRNRRGPD